MNKSAEGKHLRSKGKNSRSNTACPFVTGKGASPNDCYEIYCGPYPESEPEVKAVARFIRDHKDIIKAYITMHSYSQLVLFPYSYTTKKSKDHDELVSLPASLSFTFISELLTLLGYACNKGATMFWRSRNWKWNFSSWELKEVWAGLAVCKPASYFWRLEKIKYLSQTDSTSSIPDTLKLLVKEWSVSSLDNWKGRLGKFIMKSCGLHAHNLTWLCYMEVLGCVTLKNTLYIWKQWGVLVDTCYFY